MPITRQTLDETNPRIAAAEGTSRATVVRDPSGLGT
jgi:hypothetical protein